MSEPIKQRENWGSRIGVILAVTGSAVGLGNFLRFPGLAAKHEGGAFMVPYFVALLLLGLPIAWAEWAMGRYGGRHGHNSPPGIFRSVWRNPLAPFVGAFSAFVPVIIYMYYIHVEGWCLAYAWYYATGSMASQAAATEGGYGGVLGQVSGMGADGALFSQLTGTGLAFILVSFVVNFFLIYRGVNKGIEWFSKLAMPALIFCAVLILVRVVTLGWTDAVTTEQVSKGYGFMWNLRPAKLADAQMWLDATGQIFFSLSVGFGLIVTYASYVRDDDDIALSATTSAAGNEFCEVALAGMIIVPAAFIFLGDKAGDIGGSSLGLGFVTLPGVFEQMPFGRWIGFLFFALLFLAAVTSSLSMLQPAIATLEEGLGLGRKASVSLLGFITAVGAGFLGYFSKGAAVLDHTDFWVGNFALYVLATIMVLVFGWALGINKGKAELDRGADLHIPGFVMILLKYISPVYLIGLLIVWFYQEAVKTPGEGETSRLQALLYEPRAQMAVGLILVVAILFMLLVAQAERRWRTKERQETEVSV